MKTEDLAKENYSYPNTKQIKFDSYFMSYAKIDSKWIIVQHITPKTTKLLENYSRKCL